MGNTGFLLCWPREVQSSIRVARESWGLHLSQCRTKKTSFRLVSRTEFSSTGATRISGSHSRLTQVVRPLLEGKQRTPLSSRVATCISWRLLSGLKGDRPPVEFGEWTRDCSLGHVGKEGPHLTMMGASREFSRAAVPVWGFHEVGWGEVQSSLHPTSKILSLAVLGEGVGLPLNSHFSQATSNSKLLSLAVPTRLVQAAVLP